jgi:hypothetical protein
MFAIEVSSFVAMIIAVDCGFEKTKSRHKLKHLLQKA